MMPTFTCTIQNHCAQKYSKGGTMIAKLAILSQGTTRISLTQMFLKYFDGICYIAQFSSIKIDAEAIYLNSKMLLIFLTEVYFGMKIID